MGRRRKRYNRIGQTHVHDYDGDDGLHQACSSPKFLVEPSKINLTGDSLHRGRGPLKTTMDVINAAKKISEAGINLDKLTRQIADQCPESSTKKDLLAYLQRIALYCHQLNITSKVKADVQNISGELIVSGVSRVTDGRNMIFWVRFNKNIVFFTVG